MTMHQKYGSGAPKIWIRCAQNMDQVCPKYGSGAPKIWIRCAKIWIRCAQNMDQCAQNSLKKLEAWLNEFSFSGINEFWDLRSLRDGWERRGYTIFWSCDPIYDDVTGYLQCWGSRSSFIWMMAVYAKDKLSLCTEDRANHNIAAKINLGYCCQNILYAGGVAIYARGRGFDSRSRLLYIVWTNLCFSLFISLYIVQATSVWPYSHAKKVQSAAHVEL
jgi:hypothetical protein